MTVDQSRNGDMLTVRVAGRLDAANAKQLSEKLKDSLNGVTELTIDLSELEYISSAGLRVLLSTQKIMNRQGAMKVAGVGETVMEFFEAAGFRSILHFV